MVLGCGPVSDSFTLVIREARRRYRSHNAVLVQSASEILMIMRVWALMSFGRKGTGNNNHPLPSALTVIIKRCCCLLFCSLVSSIFIDICRMPPAMLTSLVLQFAYL
jgi:hypothetical protein